MSSNTTLPRLFGPYLLTRNLATDLLGEAYRAGTTAGAGLKPLLLIRMFNGEAIDREAILPAMETAVEYLEEVKGPAVAKGAVLGIVDDTPFAGIEYVPGRTLDSLLLGGGGNDVVAMPIEHALLITEKILIALEAAKPFAKATGAPHGFLTPAFVSVSNDGDTRVFGTGLGPGLLPSLKHPKAMTTYGPYIAPEVIGSGKPSSAGDIYSSAVILLECLTGKSPTAGGGVDAVQSAVLALNGNPLPDDIKKLLLRGLDLDPSKRAADVVAYRKELGKLLYGGPYAPSTFNLAFFMHQHFEKAIEKERKELAAEEQIDPKPLLAREEAAAKASAAPRAAAPRPVSIPSFGVAVDTKAGVTMGGTPMPKKEKGFPVIPVVGVVIAIGIAVALTMSKGGKKEEQAVTPTPVVEAPKPTATPAPPPTPKILGAGTKEFEEALQAQLAAELKKQEQDIKKKQEAAAAAKAADDAKQADLAKRAEEAQKALQRAQEQADKSEQERLKKESDDLKRQQEEARELAAKAVPKTTKGMLIEDVSQVDRPPSALKVVKPEATRLAITRHVSGTVLMKVLVSETGKPEKVEILRDTNPKVGLADACKTALQQWEWTPAMKDGVEVKTYIVVPIPFQGL